MTRPYRCHSLETRQHAVGRVAAGESIERVSFDMDLAKALLWQWCRDAGVRSQHQPFTHPDMQAAHRARMASDDQRHAARALFAQGVPYRVVARQVGVSPTAAYNWRRQWQTVADQGGTQCVPSTAERGPLSHDRQPCAPEAA